MYHRLKIRIQMNNKIGACLYEIAKIGYDMDYTWLAFTYWLYSLDYKSQIRLFGIFIELLTTYTVKYEQMNDVCNYIIANEDKYDHLKGD